MLSKIVTFTDLAVCLDEAKGDFELLLLFRGVPFVSKSELKKVNIAGATFLVHPPASVLLEIGKRCVLLSNGLFDPFQAQVSSLDLVAGLLEVDGLSSAPSSLSARRELRVEPASPLDAELHWESEILDCQLVDISMSGAGLRISASDTLDSMRRGDAVHLAFDLPDNDSILLSGPVRSVEKAGNFYRLAVHFPLEMASRANVLRYVMTRRSEIRQEVEKRYEQAYREQLALRSKNHSKK